MSQLIGMDVCNGMARECGLINTALSWNKPMTGEPRIWVRELTSTTTEAVLSLCSEPGSGVSLTTFPVELKLAHAASALFSIRPASGTWTSAWRTVDVANHVRIINLFETGYQLSADVDQRRIHDRRGASSGYKRETPGDQVGLFSERKSLR